MRTADALIVGGGVTGVSVAFHLAGLGMRRIVVLERAFLGAGGTGRSVGIIRQLYPTPETCQMVLRSLGVFQRFGEAVAGESGYVGCGALIAVSPAMRPTLEKTLALQRSLGIRAEILDPADVAAVEPRIDPAGLGAVLHEPESGYGDPAAVTAGYAEAARRRGVVIEQGAEVTAIRLNARSSPSAAPRQARLNTRSSPSAAPRQAHLNTRSSPSAAPRQARAGDRVLGVTLASGETIDAPVVVNAAGLWSPRLARLAGVELPIVIGRHPVFVVERGEAFGPPHAVYMDLAGGSYARPETGGLTLTGSLTDDETQHPMDPDLLGSEAGFEEAVPVLERTARAIPRLADARLRRSYAGAFDITPDWMPILDETPVAGFFVAAGMSGHGFKLAPAVGEMMAARITGTASPVSLAPFSLGRFAAAGASGTFVSSYLT